MFTLQGLGSELEGKAEMEAQPGAVLPQDETYAPAYWMVALSYSLFHADFMWS